MVESVKVTFDKQQQRGNGKSTKSAKIRHLSPSYLFIGTCPVVHNDQIQAVTICHPTPISSFDSLVAKGSVLGRTTSKH